MSGCNLEFCLSARPSEGFSRLNPNSSITAPMDIPRRSMIALICRTTGTLSLHSNENGAMDGGVAAGGVAQPINALNSSHSARDALDQAFFISCSRVRGFFKPAALSAAAGDGYFPANRSENIWSLQSQSLKVVIIGTGRCVRWHLRPHE